MAFNKKVGERLTYEEVKEFAKSLGFCLLEDEYVANNIKMKMMCKEGHISYKSVKNLQDCPTCNECKLKEKNLQIYLKFKNVLEGNGYKMVSSPEELLTKKTKLKTICPNGHEYEVSYEKFVQQNRRCGKCCNNQKLQDEVVRKELSKYGFKWINGEYKNNNSQLTVECEHGHVYQTTYPTIKRYGHCKYCYGYKGEIRILEYLNKNNIKVEVQKNI